MGNVSIHETVYGLYGQCAILTNGIVDLCVTTAVGPRIIRYGFTGQQNEFCEDATMSLPVGKEDWHLMGGHRLWHSPEAFPRTYEPDNSPVQWEIIEDGVKIICDATPLARIKKEMIIQLTPDSSKVRIVHTLINKNAWAVRLAVWALSVMAPGGFEIIPIAPREVHYSDGAKGARSVVLWAYTRMNDPRLHWGEKYVIFKQDATCRDNIKIGFSNEEGWAAYINRSHMFIKKYPYIHGAEYPDHGCSLESFSIDFMHEIESLSPLAEVKPDEAINHVEEWELADHITLDKMDEGDIEQIIQKHIK